MISVDNGNSNKMYANNMSNMTPDTISNNTKVSKKKACFLLLTSLVLLSSIIILAALSSSLKPQIAMAQLDSSSGGDSSGSSTSGNSNSLGSSGPQSGIGCVACLSDLQSGTGTDNNGIGSGQQTTSDPCPEGYFLSTSTGKCEVKEMTSSGNLTDNNGITSDGGSSSAGFLVYSNPQLGFKISYPAGSQVQEGQYIKGERHVKFIFNTPEAGRGTAQVTAMQIGNMRFDVFVKAGRGTRDQVVYDQRTTLSGQPAEAVIFRSTFSGYTISHLSAFVKVGGTGYYLLFSSAASGSTFNTFAQTSGAMLNSFEITQGSSTSSSLQPSSPEDNQDGNGGSGSGTGVIPGVM